MNLSRSLLHINIRSTIVYNALFHSVVDECVKRMTIYKRVWIDACRTRTFKKPSIFLDTQQVLMIDGFNTTRGSGEKTTQVND